MILYNTLTKRKEKFIPIDGKNIKMYSCGPTVYNFIHIGNARPLCVFDMLRRYLKFKGFNVLFVQNFTDVDDKIINRANEENVGFSDISEKYIHEFKKDSSGLNVMEADIHPKASETIKEIIEMIKGLISKGVAYESEGDVYFSSLKFKDYGKLSGQSLEDLKAGARVATDERKNDPLDFALWKSSKPNEPYWDSPWGKGRPGWHIECSAMIKKHLGDTIDIHCGGQDLIFPHHENEIAQSESLTGKPLSRFWLHNGFINIDNKKMSKSLNNFFTVREISEKFGYQPIRYLMISSHYRSPLNFSEESILHCKNSLERLSNFKRNISTLERSNDYGECDLFESLGSARNSFFSYMDDDLNVSGALSVIFDMIKDVNKNLSSNEKFSKQSIKKVLNFFDDAMNIFGLKIESGKIDIPDDIKELIKQRDEARSLKNWNEADRIRGILQERGYFLFDRRI